MSGKLDVVVLFVAVRIPNEAFFTSQDGSFRHFITKPYFLLIDGAFKYFVRILTFTFFTYPIRT